MSEKSYNIYKMDSFGILHEVSSESPIYLFNLEEIIVVYSIQKVTLFIWEGIDAPEKSKSKVPIIKGNYLKTNPGITNKITPTEKSGKEAPAFCKLLDFNKRELTIHLTVGLDEADTLEKIDKKELTSVIAALSKKSLECHNNGDLKKTQEKHKEIVDIIVNYIK